MFEKDAGGDDESGVDGDDLDSDRLYEVDLGSDGEADGTHRSALGGPGLTEPERELADELERVRGLEATRDRFVRDAGIGAGGDGDGTGHRVDRDALAIIEAAGRFGSLELTHVDQEEVESITEALALHATREPKPLGQYDFYAVITKQGTTANGNITLTMTVPWEHHDEVFRALETMPFTAMVKMSEVAAVEQSGE